MKKVYFLPGLGADKRGFSFLDLSFCQPQFIQWPTPMPNETLPSYAERLFTLINDEEATIVGLSFGGMLATEIAKQHPKTKAIIISSAKTYREIPMYLRFWKRLPIYNLIVKERTKTSSRFVLQILGAQGIEQKKVQHEILMSSNPAFTRWAMDAIVKWNNIVVPKNVIHIHGTADRLLPYRYVKADYTVAGGEHVMIMDKAPEVSALLKTLCIT
ncbi:MAG: alpha/beta hydrolase [Segetibacter sp.]|jgi:pimeloyl-ACP methyl ester carboxylesterase|nr:alpha/beta hydrolase [Segetibacter sp.]